MSSASGWEALAQWGENATRIDRLTGGVANDVWSVRINGQLAVGRLGNRSDADLKWEAELLQYLDSKGLTVPVFNQAPCRSPKSINKSPFTLTHSSLL